MSKQPKPPIEICILAAGMGSRMRSSRPKALQKLAGRPLLAHLLATLERLEPTKIHIVIGQEAEQIKAAFPNDEKINWVMQHERLGTGHAVMQAADQFSMDSRLLILLGDAPLVSLETLQSMLDLDSDLGVLSVDMPDPFNYGRILRDDRNQVIAIVEERDATAEQRKIREINTGGMVANAKLLGSWLADLNCDNEQKEYLLTDIVEIASRSGNSVTTYKTPDPLEVTGINTFSQLTSLERAFQVQAAERLMAAGAHIIDPRRFDLRGELNIGQDVVIDINVVFEGKVTLGDGVSIGPNCVIKDSRIGANSVIKPNSMIDDAIIDEQCSVGPFARLRPGTYLKKAAAIGNFVEVKKSTIGEGTKASHLAYLGDSTIGNSVNIGAGTITCNYDGVNKHQTHIGDHVFVGSNSSLVAPVTISEGATIGAGSTITKNVDKNVLALGRGRQATISPWARPVKKG